MKNEFDVENDSASSDLKLDIHYPNSFNATAEVEKVAKDTGFGSVKNVNFLSLHGFNYFRSGQALAKTSRNNMGFTFFTRPILNLTYDNLSMRRSMQKFKDAKDPSFLRAVRALLDPWGSKGMKPIVNDSQTLSSRAKYDVSNSNSVLVNDDNPFIPILSNSLLNLSGWRDIAINDYTSKAGIHNEQWSMVDGFFKKTEAFEMSSSFRNTEGDPVSLLITTWLDYMIGCREFEMVPYPDFVEEREWDYNTKIYRFVMDNTKTYIRKWATTIAFPLSVPTGNTFNFASDKNFIDGNSELAVTWKCIGAEYNEKITFYEFNKLVSIYCPDLTVDYSLYDEVGEKIILKKANSDYMQLKRADREKAVFFAVPLINYVTNELTWWIKKDDYFSYINTEADREKVENEIAESRARAMNKKDESRTTYTGVN